MSQEARDWLATKGYDRAMGARPMGRVIQDNLKNRWRTSCCLARWSMVVRSLSLDSDKNTLTYDFQSAPKHKPEAAH